MKRFNPKKELSKKRIKSIFSVEFVNQITIPILVVCCLFLAILGISFSSLITFKTGNKYYVKINVINGNVTSYSKIVLEGEFADTFSSSYDYGTIECETGELSFDPLTSVVSGSIHTNTKCTLIFDEPVQKALSVELPTINDNNGVSSYYKANAKNNYIMVEDMLFRIVRENGDGSLRVMLNDTVLSSDYNHIDATLDAWYNRYFNNKEYVLRSDYDVTNYVDFETYNLINFEGYKVGYVGLLSVREASVILDDCDSSYFDTYSGMYLGNQAINDAWAYKNGKLTIVKTNNTLSLKPVINIMVDIKDGDGTANNPYVF